MLKIRTKPEMLDNYQKVDPSLTAEVPAGRFVMKVSGKTGLVKPSDGTAVYGLLAQDVKLFPGTEYLLPYGNHQAYPGDPVGIYKGWGIFETDQFVYEEGTNTYTEGAKIYVTTEGQITDQYDATPSNTKGAIAVGRVVQFKGGTLLFELALDIEQESGSGD